MQIPPTIFPKKFLTDAYSSIVTALPFGRVYLNTIISTVVTTVVQVLFCSMAAYAFARIEFPFKNAIFVLVLSVLMVPGQIFLIPQYRIVQSLGLLDTIPALFLPNLFSAFGTFLLRQFFMSLPKELEEAALLDGCNRFQIFGRIMLPLTKAGIVSLVIFTAKFAWNDFMWPLIVNTSMDKMTLGPALSTLQGQYTTKYPMQMAGAVLAVVPLIVIFFLFQKLHVIIQPNLQIKHKIRASIQDKKLLCEIPVFFPAMLNDLCQRLKRPVPHRHIGVFLYHTLVRLYHLHLQSFPQFFHDISLSSRQITLYLSADCSQPFSTAQSEPADFSAMASAPSRKYITSFSIHLLYPGKISPSPVIFPLSASYIFYNSQHKYH